MAKRMNAAQQERGFAFVRLESTACVRQWVCTLASPFVAEVGGVNIHAGVAVRGRDRDRSRSPGFGATLPLCDEATDCPRKARGARRWLCRVCVS